MPTKKVLPYIRALTELEISVSNAVSNVVICGLLALMYPEVNAIVSEVLINWFALL